MKKLSFYVLAIVGLLFAACTADRDVAVGEDPQGEGRADGYMALAINLPVTPQVRAANDDFNDGTSNEYRVADCALLLFQGATEDAAKLLNAQEISLPFDKTDKDQDNDNITTSYLATAKVEGHTTGAKLWALAVLNFGNIISIDTDGVPTIAGNKVAIGSSLKTIRAIDSGTLTCAKFINDNENKKNYFFMTNAVLSTVPGGATNDPTTPYSSTKGTVQPGIFQLAELDPKMIFETEAEAKDNPAGEIFVERAVAKATLKVQLINSADVLITQNDIEEVTWTIDNMEPKTFVFRNPGNDNDEKELKYIGYTSGYFSSGNYRFVGNTSLDFGNGHNHGLKKDAYRTYWCVDPQYSTEATGMLPVRNSSGVVSPAPTYVSQGETPLYCFENTFNVENQSYKNTTRAIIKVKLKETSTFYTVNDGISTFSDQATAVGEVAASLVTNTDVVDIFNENVNSGKLGSFDKTAFYLSVKLDDATGQLKVTNIELSSTFAQNNVGDGKIYSSDLPDALKSLFNKTFIDALNKKIVVRQYSGGIMYYEARFRHFAGNTYSDGTPGTDDLAPWNVKKPNTWESTPSGGSTSAAYNTDDEDDKASKNYLGRYGMVRNNWYDVTVTEFKKRGYPTDPSGQVNNPDFDDPNTPDDNINDYLSVKINVLSWAKRTQSWGF